MKSPIRWATLLTVASASTLFGLSFVTGASTNGRESRFNNLAVLHEADGDDRRSSFEEVVGKVLDENWGTGSIEQSINSGPASVSTDPDNDPDLPPALSGRIDKETYLRLRADYIDMRRGRQHPLASYLRGKAIEKMNNQEAEQKLHFRGSSLTPLLNTSSWTPLGPAPIPNGQTDARPGPVSGRTTAIAVHPTDPNIVYVGTAQGGLYKSTDGGANWTALFDFQLESLSIGAITIDPIDNNIVYIGTGEANFSGDTFAGVGLYIIRDANSSNPTLTGPFRLDDSGQDVFSGRAIGRIVVNPNNNNVIFVCTATGIGGNPSTLPLAPALRGIYRSTNAHSGNPTFSQIQITGISNNRSTVDLALDPANPNLLLAAVVAIAGEGGIYRTTNALDATPTFIRTLPLPDFATHGRAALYLNRNGASLTIYAATGEISSASLGGPDCTSSTAGVLRRSTDSGLTWSTPLADTTGFCGFQCFYDIAVAATPDNQTIYIGGQFRSDIGSCEPSIIKRSTDGGASFAPSAVGLHADTHVLAIAPSNPSIVYTGNDGGIWKSTDNGATWINLNNADFSATQFQSLAVHPFDRFFTIGGTQDNGTDCLGPDGITWTTCRGGDGGYTIIDNNAFDTVKVTMYHTFFNLANGPVGYERADNTSFQWIFRGCSGSTANNGFRCADNVLFYAPMEQGPGNPNKIYFGTDRLYRSMDKGDTMSLASQGPLVPSSPGATSGIVLTTIGISPQDDNVRIVCLRNGRVFATTTGSTSMSDVTGANFPPENPDDAGSNSIGRAVIDPNNKFTAYITFTSFSPPLGQQIFKTTNLDSPTPTWVPASSGIPTVPVSSFVVDPQDSNSLYAGTDIGVYHSSDGGANWAPLGTGLPRLAVFDMKINNVQRILRIATHGRGLYEIEIPGQKLPVLRNGGATLVSENCTPFNGSIDPGEDVTVSVTINNIGAGPTSSLMVTLLGTGGVINQSGPQTYGAIDAGSTASRDFSFTASGICDGMITATFHLQDGTTDYGNIAIMFTLGELVTSAPIITEDFDWIAAPALPTGWTTAHFGTAPLWATTASFNDTPPNSAATGGTALPGDNTIDSPVIPIPTPPAIGVDQAVQLAFSINYNTESGFDGGVLEISINGGAFQDIVTAGGSFASGGYNATIGSTNSVLSGRQAWSGNSGGFIITVVNLPAGAFGQNAQFRWRTAYDKGTNPPLGGMRIDRVSLYTVTRVCCQGACIPEGPVITAIAATPNSLWPPNHEMLDVAISYNAIDNCELSCALSVASNEPDNGLGDGDLAPDWQVLDAHHVRLRAERSANGEGRVYTITIDCVDVEENHTIKTVTVAVPKTQS